MFLHHPYNASRPFTALCLALCFVIPTATTASPWDRPETKVLVRAQALQQRMFRQMRPATRALDHAHAGTAAWWLARRDAQTFWLRYVDDLRQLHLPPGQLEALTWAKRGGLRRLHDSLNAANTLAWTGTFIRRPPKAVLDLPPDPRDLPQTGGRVRFSGRTVNGVAVLIVDTQTCDGDERTMATLLAPSPGIGGKSAVVQRTGLELGGAGPGAPSPFWAKLRARNAKQGFGKQPFFRQSSKLVQIRGQVARYRGPGHRRDVKLPPPPTRKQIPWKQRACCNWAVNTVLVDPSSGRVFAGLEERCDWSEVPGERCYDAARQSEAYANQTCELSELLWLRFGKVMRINQLFERPAASYPMNRAWRLPVEHVVDAPTEAELIPALAEERKGR